MSKKFVKGFPKIGFTVAAVAATALLTGAHSASASVSEHQSAIREMAWMTPAKTTRVQAPGGEYTVRAGDTLALIAGREYGSAGCWPGIYAANAGAIRNPDLIYVGQTLAIPAGCGTRGPVQTEAVTQPDTAPPGGGDGGVNSSFQACVIRTESGGNPTAVNPSSGAGGLYGFLPSTWQSLGFSGLPEDASVATQTEAFWKEYDLMGVSPWQPSDGC